ncbi:hypothetical protein AZE42_09371 [Rhizopogon vesiculosus]|uniref:Amino acid permease/ SLC12A domain-containing protein n=1 Tax=Rhizopogon vesiculosus TaxID=180088 RepID=A0A1J8QL32_9AGAM|nr:hypothetical protein AZE42_09371 [Rhizopogon vesiculosus]
MTQSGVGTRDMESREHAIAKADEALLAELGYKQEFKRAFTPLEVFGIAFSIIGLLPSIAYDIFPRDSSLQRYSSNQFCVVQYSFTPFQMEDQLQWSGWAVASLFILCVGMSMAELGSAAPTSGGLYFWTHSLSSPRCRNLLAWIVGCKSFAAVLTAKA